MRRFLLRFAYIGSRFGGMQRQKNGVLPSIQETLERAIQKLYPKNEALVTTSSRTDKGVHALMNALHVDLEHPKDGCEYDCEWIKEQLNRDLDKSGHDLVVTNVSHVSPNFNCRKDAISRSYVYRLALVDWSDDVIRSRVPIAELDRCYFVRPPLCEASLNEAAQLFSGVRDFKTFSSNSGEFKLSVRQLQVNVHRSTGLMPSLDPLYDSIIFYNLHFKARSFLYNQVRKMTSVMVAAGQGIIGLNDIFYLLDTASFNCWPPGIGIAPAHGLYLRRIEYKESDLLPPS